MRLTIHFMIILWLVGWSTSHTKAQNNTVKGNNQFAVELFKKLTKEKSTNFFMSPYSISSALAMVYAGADGNTAEEMTKVLHFVPKTVHQDFKKLTTSFDALNKLGVKLKVANALWVAKNTKLLSDYTQKMNKYYQAKATNLDFAKQAEQSRMIINQWVEDKTNHKIKHLLPKGFIDGNTSLVLTNAVYLKAEWMHKFNKKETKEMTFYAREQQFPNIPFMHLEQTFHYFETQQMQIIDIPYKNYKMSMLILLPKDKNHLPEVIRWFDAETINGLEYEMTPAKVKLALPRFKMTIRTSLKKPLKQLGLQSIFQQADFNKMSNSPVGDLSEVIHKAFIDVNETGTEAAAATAGSITRSGETPKIFKADHPFLFVIRDVDSGSILFIGKLESPITKK
ncbi:hypothetical protein BKI52_17735 [marine bacterium AO1-C]|nr:hypothetical protein BKI52_17735 [marine bacterium AO1-C]